MKGLRIALVHNLKPPVKAEGLPADYYSECDSPKTVQSIAKALRKAGHTVLPVEADRHLPRWFGEHSLDLAFNISEGFEGESREARVPALLELLEIPYTGSGVLALTLALDKAKSKQLFRAVGVPTPNFQLFCRPDEPLDKRLHFPLIVKPNREGSGKGIWAASVVRDEEAIRRQVKKVFTQYAQEVLVEEYIDGLELTVGILGGEVLPVLEIDFSKCQPSGEYFYSWRMKEFQGNKEMHLTPRFWCPGRLDPPVTQAVQAVALKAARAVGYRDIARVDIRLSSDGIPYVLEVNPLPGLDPEESNMPLMAQAAGVSYEAFIQRIVHLAVERSPKHCGQVKVKAAPPSSQKEGARSSIPSSKDAVPSSAASPGRALPDSGKSPSGSPGNPVIAVPQGPRRPGASRNGDPKEEHLGR